jgi:hypothetical protein
MALRTFDMSLCGLPAIGADEVLGPFQIFEGRAADHALFGIASVGHDSHYTVLTGLIQDERKVVGKKTDRYL